MQLIGWQLAVSYTLVINYSKLLSVIKSQHIEQEIAAKQLMSWGRRQFNIEDSIGFIPDCMPSDAYSASYQLGGMYVYPIIINQRNYGYWGYRGIKMSPEYNYDQELIARIAAYSNYLVGPDWYNYSSNHYVAYVQVDAYNIAVADLNLSRYYAEIVTSKYPINRFFLRSNYLIIVYQDINLVPDIFVINSKVSITQANIVMERIASAYSECCKINSELKNHVISGDKGGIYSQLSWDVDRRQHKLRVTAGNTLVTYIFSLSIDNALLSYINTPAE